VAKYFISTHGDFMKKQLVALGLFSLMSLPVIASDFYVVGDIGSVKWSGGGDSESKTTYLIGGGYKFNEIMSVELSYRDMGKVSESDGSDKFSLAFTAIQLSAVASYAINDTTALYGRLGMAQITADASVRVGGFSGSDTDSKNKALFGLGARFAISENAGVRLEYSQYGKYEDLKLSPATIGFDYHF
jgi:OmpA-OmpF porin, OOP family